MDTQQINLSRFNLRFPEKRPFFLENSGLFYGWARAHELDCSSAAASALDENGLLVPIVAGGRLTGKVSAGGPHPAVPGTRTRRHAHVSARELRRDARQQLNCRIGPASAQCS